MSAPHLHLPRTDGPLSGSVASLAALFWFFVTATLAFTAALIVLAGAGIVGSTTVAVVVGALFVLFVVHTVSQYRHRQDALSDVRLRHARERRGF